jgi:O-antigen/teichoic acid export membrane protein
LVLLGPIISNLSARYRHLRENRAEIMRALAVDSKRSFWAMVDQGVVSLGNFGVNILLGAYFYNSSDLSDFGSFWILMEPILFLNSMQQALLIYPFTVRGTLMDRKSVGRTASMCMLLTIGAWPVLAVALLLTSLIAHIGVSVGCWAAGAMLLWQLQETLRRSLTMQLRFRAAVLGDAVSYLGQVALVAGLAWLGKLSLVGTFQVMAITSGVAACIQGVQVGIAEVKFNELPRFVRDCWSLGRWVAFGNLSNLISGPVFSWNFAYWAGKQLLGIYYTLTNLLRLTNPLAITISSLIMPNATRARHAQGMKEAKSVMKRFTLLGGLVLLPYLAVLFIFPAASIDFALRSRAEDLFPYIWALRAAVIYSALSYVAVATGSLLNAVERSRWTFNAQFIYAAGVILLVLPLSAFYNVLGANIGAALAVMPVVAAHVYYIRKLSDNEPVADRLPAVEGASGDAKSSSAFAAS